MLFYIIENIQKTPEIYTIRKNNTVYRHWTDLHIQAKNINYDIKIYSGSIQDAPREIEDKAICFLDECTMIESDYLIKLISSYNLYRFASCFCGPVLNDKDENFQYKLFSFSALSYKITKEIHNYPRINNILIPQTFYNKVGGYYPLITPRKTYCCDLSFFERLSEYGDIVYLNNLTSHRIFPEKENFNKLYYNMGYEDKKFKIEKTVEDFAYKISLAESEYDQTMDFFN